MREPSRGAPSICRFRAMSCRRPPLSRPTKESNTTCMHPSPRRNRIPKPARPPCPTGRAMNTVTRKWVERDREPILLAKRAQDDAAVKFAAHVRRAQETCCLFAGGKQCHANAFGQAHSATPHQARWKPESIDPGVPGWVPKATSQRSHFRCPHHWNGFSGSCRAR